MEREPVARVERENPRGPSASPQADDLAVRPPERASDPAPPALERAALGAGGRRVRGDHGGVTLTRILETLSRGAAPPYEVASTGTDGDLEAFAPDWGLGDDFVDLLVESGGSDVFDDGRLTAHWVSVSGAEAWADLFVLYFDNGVVLSVEFQTRPP